MDFDSNIGFLRQAFWQIIMAAGPVLGIALAVGLIIGIIQAATSINEMTLSFVPKLVIVVASLALLSNFIMLQLTDYFAFVFDQITRIGGRGACGLFGRKRRRIAGHRHQYDGRISGVAYGCGTQNWRVPHRLAIFGARYVLLPIRILFTMVMAVILVPNIDIPDSQLIGTATGVAVIVKEISIGLAAGLIVTIWFSPPRLPAKKCLDRRPWVCRANGPASGAQTPVVSQILNLLLVVLFLSLDAHLLVISIILKSYEISPSLIRPTSACLSHRALRRRA